jgi:adenylate cyclase
MPEDSARDLEIEEAAPAQPEPDDSPNKPGIIMRVGRRIRRAFSFDRVIGLIVLTALMGLYFWNPAPIQGVRLWVFDLYQQAKPREIPPPAAKPVTIIDLDEQSLQTVGQWPWSRNTIAQLVANLTSMEAVLVAFDVVFAEPDRMNPNTIPDNVEGLDEETVAKLRGLPSNDKVLADVIAKSKVVLGQAGRVAKTDDSTKGPPARRSLAIRKLSKTAPDPKVFMPHFPYLTRNIPELEQAAKRRGGHGIFSVSLSEGGVIRNVPAFFIHEDNYFPALAIEMLRVAFNRSTLLVNVNDGGVAGIGIKKGVTIKTDRHGRIWPYYSKHDKDKYVSAADVLAGTVDPAMIKGKLTILGTSAVGLRDIRTIPTESDIPGVEVHAQLIEAIVSGNYLTRPFYADAVELAFILFGGLVMIVLVPWIGARWTAILFVVTAVGAGGASWYLFAEHRMLFDASLAIASILLLYTLLTYTGYAKEEAQRRQTRDAFSKYLSPAMVAQVVENPSLLSLGGVKRDMTLLFCDVRGFTSISELFDAEGLTVLINKLLTPLTDVILARDGTIDKYMGDCIMAFWNAPLDDGDHARQGCLSALEMLAAMAPLNDRLEQEAKEEGRKHIPLRVGLGLNSGECVVGNMGTAQRMDYSVLGDTVNTAARLEGQSKNYGVDIVIGPNTLVQVPELATIELDIVQVKGKTVGLDIYALMGDAELANDPEFLAMNAANDEMLAAYRGQQWSKAHELVDNLRVVGKQFNLDVLCDLYDGRINAYEEDPPPADWDGVFIATTK